MNFKTPLSLSLALTAGACIATQTYHYTDIGRLGTYEIPRMLIEKVNCAGQAVGYESLGDNSAHPFLFSDGMLVDLGTFGGTHGGAYGINDQGQVVGAADKLVGTDDQSHAFLYTMSGGMVDLGTFGGLHCQARAINSSGQVLLIVQQSDGTGSHTAIYKDGSVQDLGVLYGRNGVGQQMNDNGDIAGEVLTNPNGDTSAFLYSGGQATAWSLDYQNQVRGINASGQVVGFATNMIGHARAYRYSNGVAQFLPSFAPGTSGYDSMALGINDLGYVVGEAYAASGSYAGVIWSPDGAITDLNSLVDGSIGEYSIYDATAISNNGIIGVLAADKEGNYRMGLLTPNPVPEPMSLVGLGLGGLLLVGRKRRKR